MSGVQTACPAGGMLHGCKLAGTVATQLTDQAPAKPLFRGVIISNQSGNPVAVGGSDVVVGTGSEDEATGGIIVPSGQVVPFPVDDPRQLYIVSGSGNDLVSWWAI